MTATLGAALDQRRRALARANYISSARAIAKRRMKRGALPLREALDLPEIATMQVGDLLMNVPAWGRVKVTKLLTRRSISWTRHVEALTEAQRDYLLDAIESWAPSTH